TGGRDGGRSGAAPTGDASPASGTSLAGSTPHAGAMLHSGAPHAVHGGMSQPGTPRSGSPPASPPHGPQSGTPYGSTPTPPRTDQPFPQAGQAVPVAADLAAMDEPQRGGPHLRACDLGGVFAVHGGQVFPGSIRVVIGHPYSPASLGDGAGHVE